MCYLSHFSLLWLGLSIHPSAAILEPFMFLCLFKKYKHKSNGEGREDRAGTYSVSLFVALELWGSWQGDLAGSVSPRLRGCWNTM